MVKTIVAIVVISIVFVTNSYAGQSNDYVGLTAGLLLPSASKLTDKNGSSATLSYDNMGVSAGASIGHQFGMGLRVEEEISYKKGVTNKFTYAGTDNKIENNVWSIGAMSNLYYDWYHNVDVMADATFSPYVGMGLGLANVHMSEGTVNSSKVWSSGSDTAFAYQIIIGSGTKIAKNVVLDVSYRYFNASDITIDQINTNFSNHNVLLGIRYAFR